MMTSRRFMVDRFDTKISEYCPPVEKPTGSRPTSAASRSDNIKEFVMGHENGSRDYNRSAPKAGKWSNVDAASECGGNSTKRWASYSQEPIQSEAATVVDQTVPKEIAKPATPVPSENPTRLSTFFGRYYAENPRPRSTSLAESTPSVSDIADTYSTRPTVPVSAPVPDLAHPVLTPTPPVRNVVEEHEKITKADGVHAVSATAVAEIIDPVSCSASLFNRARNLVVVPESDQTSSGDQQSIYSQEPLSKLSTLSKFSTLSLEDKNAKSTCTLNNSSHKAGMIGGKIAIKVCQTSGQQEDWSWYPFHADMLKYPADLKVGAVLKVYACAVIDPKCVFLIHDVDDSHPSTLEKMSGEMAANAMHLGHFTAFPPAGFVVCAWDSKYKQWGRGVILEHSADNHAWVLFLDYGTASFVKLEEILQIKASWMKILRKTFFAELEDVPAPPGGFFSEKSISSAESFILLEGNQLILKGSFSVTDIQDGDFIGKWQFGKAAQSIVTIYNLYGILDEEEQSESKP